MCIYIYIYSCIYSHGYTCSFSYTSTSASASASRSTSTATATGTAIATSTATAASTSPCTSVYGSLASSVYALPHYPFGMQRACNLEWRPAERTADYRVRSRLEVVLDTARMGGASGPKSGQNDLHQSQESFANCLLIPKASGPQHADISLRSCQMPPASPAASRTSPAATRRGKSRREGLRKARAALLQGSYGMLPLWLKSDCTNGL